MLSSANIFIMCVSLLLGGTAGFVMHRSDFCFAGIFRNFFMFRQTFMLRILLLLVVTSMGLFELARVFGFLAYYPYPWSGSASLSHIVGAFLFGVGMVLAGGCVVGTLYKMGSGSLLSLLAFFGLLAGSVVYAEFHHTWKALFENTVVFPGQVTLPQVLNVEPAIPVVIIVLVFILLSAGPWRSHSWTRDSSVDGYLQPWMAALLLALTGLLSYIFVGMPLGITTAYTKMGAMVEQLFAPVHVAGLPYFQAKSLSYIPPFAKAVIQGGAGPQFDAVAVIQYPVIAGIVLGSALSAVLLGEFKFRLNAPKRQVVSVVVGGVVMGLACRMTPGCNVWHLLGGLPILSIQAIFYLIGLVPGAWLGSLILQRYVVR